MELEIPTYAHIILSLQTKIGVLIDTYTSGGYQHLAKAYGPTISGVCVLYIIITGYLVISGKIEMPIKVFQTMAFKIGLVLSLALNWGFFSKYVVNLFFNGAEEIGDSLMTINPFPMPDILSGKGIYIGLQSVFIEVANVGAWVIQKGNWHNWGPILNGWLIQLTGGLVTILAFAEITIAKISMAVLFCTAPLFVAFTLFDFTKSMFDRWIGALAGCSFVVILSSAVVSIYVSLLHWTVAGHFVNKAVGVSIVGWMPIAFVALLCIPLISQIASIGRSIAGGCSSGGASAAMGGLVGGFLGASRAGGNLAKPVLNPASKLARQAVSNLRPQKIAQKVVSAGASAGTRMMQSVQSRLQGGKK